jgi:DNA-binding beta-propeller fold protein YncE
MSKASRVKLLCGIAFAAITMSAMPGHAQAPGTDPNAAPNAYRVDEGWAKQPMGRGFGMVIGLNAARDGKSMWIFDRCGARSCEDSKIAPLNKYDADGHVVASIATGLTVFPHGLYVDKDDNIWITDGQADKNKKKGDTVMKLSPDGKVLMTLGTPGQAGDDATHFNGPSDVIVAPNGDIFVADGHGEKTNARIVKFSADGKFIKAWGKAGAEPGEFNVPHGLAFDSAGRLFVADRANNRIQIFDQDGKFLDQWKQFGRPSGIWIDKNDAVYVADSQSNEKTNPGFKQGIRIGDAKEGKVTGFIEESEFVGSLEGVGVDDKGNIFAGYTGSQNLRRFVKKETQ